MAPLGGSLLSLNPLSFLIGLGTFLLSIFLIQHLLVGKINWGKFSGVFKVAGSQIVGRLVGLALALVAIYLFSPEIFLPTLAAVVLVFIKHIERIKAYIAELRTRRQ